MSTILVFGASGAIGRFLLPLLTPAHRVIAVSRAASDAAVGWIRGDLNDASWTWPEADAVLSLGPLDAFSLAVERHADSLPRRIIAFSSMSAESKQASSDASERALAARLVDAEARVLDCAARTGAMATLFRPTLIYGAGSDRSLTPIVAFARRWRVLPVPLGANGLRQPVHAQDLAQACAAARENPATSGKTYALGGAERLRFDDMVRRLRACVPGPVLCLPLPLAVLRLAARLRPGAGAFSAAAVARLHESLLADNSAAARDFGYAPREFDPTAVPGGGDTTQIIQR